MIDPTNVPDVAADETLARYILQRSHMRPSDRSLKPDAFMPPPDLELSVTRHLSATEDELWSVGEDVAVATGKILYGRGDVQTFVCLDHTLVVHAAPLIPDNPNHAHVMGWPTEKPAQKNIAQEIASQTAYVPKP
jgi:hypothetical protein